MSDTWECTECQVENDLDDAVEEGQIVVCVECGTEFEIVGLGPLEMVVLDIPESDDVQDAEVEADADGDEDWD